jgi:hypothetical protein
MELTEPAKTAQAHDARANYRCKKGVSKRKKTAWSTEPVNLHFFFKTLPWEGSQQIREPLTNLVTNVKGFTSQKKKRERIYVLFFSTVQQSFYFLRTINHQYNYSGMY